MAKLFITRRYSSFLKRTVTDRFLTYSSMFVRRRFTNPFTYPSDWGLSLFGWVNSCVLNSSSYIFYSLFDFYYEGDGLDKKSSIDKTN